MKEYIHTKIGKEYISDISYTLSEKLLNYKGKQLLAIQKKLQKGSLWVLVPGFVENYKARLTPGGHEISDILEVPEELKGDVTKFLRKQSLEGNIDFW